MRFPVGKHFLSLAGVPLLEENGIASALEAGGYARSPLAMSARPVGSSVVSGLWEDEVARQLAWDGVPLCALAPLRSCLSALLDECRDADAVRAKRLLFREGAADRALQLWQHTAPFMDASADPRESSHHEQQLRDLCKLHSFVCSDSEGLRAARGRLGEFGQRWTAALEDQASTLAAAVQRQQNELSLHGALGSIPIEAVNRRMQDELRSVELRLASELSALRLQLLREYRAFLSTLASDSDQALQLRQRYADTPVSEPPPPASYLDLRLFSLSKLKDSIPGPRSQSTTSSADGSRRGHGVELRPFRGSRGLLSDDVELVVGRRHLRRVDVRLGVCPPAEICRGALLDPSERAALFRDVCSESLSAVLILVDRSYLANRSGLGELVRALEASCELYFEPYSSQLNALGASLDEGDFFVTRHSDLGGVHMVMHLVCPSSDADPSAWEFMHSGLRSRYWQGIRQVLTCCTLSSVAHLYLPAYPANPLADSPSDLRAALRRAEEALKAVRGLIADDSHASSALSRLTFYVDSDVEFATSLLPSFIRTMK